MNQNFKENERELIKQVNYFKKRAEKMIKEGKLGDEHNQLIASCETLIETLNIHAAKRTEIILQRESLKNIVKDNAECPKCHTSAQLKHVGVDKSEQGWKCNKYKCRRCNIEFVWARPNNPWDLLEFMEHFISELKQKAENTDEAEKQQSMSIIEQMQMNLEKLKPVISASDADYEEMQTRESEMSKIVNEFKTHLQIERIKMEARDN
jgi:hypothetical protein